VGSTISRVGVAPREEGRKERSESRFLPSFIRERSSASKNKSCLRKGGGREFLFSERRRSVSSRSAEL